MFLSVLDSGTSGGSQGLCSVLVNPVNAHCHLLVLFQNQVQRLELSQETEARMCQLSPHWISVRLPGEHFR